MVPLQTITATPEKDSRTIRQALAWAVNCLKKEDLPDPRLSAELILGSVLKMDRLGLLLSSDQILPDTEARSFKEKIFRRAGHEPIAYLLGQKEFWSLDFEVNPFVLIPRPETELLVEEALKCLSARQGHQTVVELGTGSGAVAVALAKSIPDPKSRPIFATDLSLPALETAFRNAGHHGVEAAVHFVLGDWLTPFSFKQRWIDLVVSNPPYIAEAEIFGLPPTVKNYEPMKALWGGPDGLEAIRSIIRQAGRQLKIGGCLFLEIGESQGAQVQGLARENRFEPTAILKDYAGRDRVLSARYHG